MPITSLSPKIFLWRLQPTTLPFADSFVLAIKAAVWMMMFWYICLCSAQFPFFKIWAAQRAAWCWVFNSQLSNGWEQGKGLWFYSICIPCCKYSWPISCSQDLIRAWEEMHTTGSCTPTGVGSGMPPEGHPASIWWESVRERALRWVLSTRMCKVQILDLSLAGKACLSQWHVTGRETGKRQIYRREPSVLPTNLWDSRES